MSEAIDIFRELKKFQRVKRLAFGIRCIKCQEEQPNRQATILEPGRICRVHRPWHRDPRPEPTSEEFAERMAAHGWTVHPQEES